MAAKKPPDQPPRPPRSRTIPAALHGAVLERLRAIDPDTQRPHTTRGVARWLEDAHGINVHQTTVARLRVAAEKHTEAQVVAALREEIAAKVPGVLAKLGRIVKRLDERANTETNTQKLAAATTAVTRALHELATLGGVAAALKVDVSSGGAPIADVRVTLATQLARLAGGAVPDAEGGPPGEPDGQ